MGSTVFKVTTESGSVYLIDDENKTWVRFRGIGETKADRDWKLHESLECDCISWDEHETRYLAGPDASEIRTESGIPDKFHWHSPILIGLPLYIYAEALNPVFKELGGVRQISTTLVIGVEEIERVS